MNNSTSPKQKLTCGFLDPPYGDSQAYLRTLFIVPTVVFGLVANGLNILMFRHVHMRASLVNWFLLTLAFADQFVLISTLFMFPIPVGAEKTHLLSMNEITIYLTMIFYPIGLFAQTSSVYLTVVVSVFRYIGVCHPFKAQRWNTSRNVKVVIVAAIGFSVILTLPRWFVLSVEPCYSNIFKETSLIIIPSGFGKSYLNMAVYSIYLYTSFMFLIPFLILLVVNVSIIQTLRSARTLRRNMTKSGNMTEYNKTKKLRRDSNGSTLLCSSAQLLQTRKATSDETSTTMMLVAMVCLFFICNTLPFVNNILYFLKYHYPEMFSENVDEIFTICTEVGNNLVTFNSAATIIIYALFSSKYYNLLLFYFCGWKVPLTGSRLSSTYTGSSRNYRAAQSLPVHGTSKSTKSRNYHSVPLSENLKRSSRSNPTYHMELLESHLSAQMSRRKLQAKRTSLVSVGAFSKEGANIEPARLSLIEQELLSSKICDL